MRFILSVEMRVFSREEDDEDNIIRKIRELFPIDFEKEKLKINCINSEGFEGRKIKILSVSINKQRHIKVFSEKFFRMFSEEQKDMLLEQIDTRLDDSLHFYIRLDKDELLAGRTVITDRGNCFRFNIAIATYPHNRDVAKEIIKRILRPRQS